MRTLSLPKTIPFLLPNADGDTTTLTPSTGSTHYTLVDEVHNLIGEEDVEDFADELEPGSSIALLVIEHVWAKPFADAVADSGGQWLGSIHIPREVVDELTA